MNSFKLGRRPMPDHRDQGHLLQAALPLSGATVLPTSKTWAINAKALDQGNTGTCVGHAWKNFLRCAPIQTSKGPSAYDIYRSAVAVDEWYANDPEANLPDGDPGLEFGTSVRAGAKAVAAMGRLQSYKWAFSLQPLVEWVLTKGPVVLGVNWYDSFFLPDAEGIVRIEANAQPVGGHAFLCRGINRKRALAACVNSWGDEWAISGNFYVPLRDLERLLYEGGEACTAVELAKTA